MINNNYNRLLNSFGMVEDKELRHSQYFNNGKLF